MHIKTRTKRKIYLIQLIRTGFFVPLAILFIASLVLTKAPASPVHAASLPLNGRLVYSSVKSGSGNQIYTIRADGTDEKQLTFYDATEGCAGSAGYPSYSADGTKIAFACHATGGNQDIWVMNADGSNQVNITQDATNVVEAWPAFSPDGTKIVMCNQATVGHQQVFIMNADGSNRQQLTNEATNEIEPQFSPDGTKIFFQSQRDGNFEIYSMNLDGSSPTNLTNDSGVDRGFTFSPDGSKIVYHHYDSVNLNSFYSMNVDGTNKTFLSAGATDGSGASNNDPFYAPDGSKIGFIHNPVAGNHYEYYTMNPNGSDIQTVTTTADMKIENKAGAWQPLTIRPTITDPNPTINSAGPQSIGYNVVANTTDAYDGINPASVTVTSAPLNGSVKIDATTGNISYTPHHNFIGADVLTYKVCSYSNAALCSTNTLHYQINPVPGAPSTGEHEGNNLPVPLFWAAAVLGTAGLGLLAWKFRRRA